MYFSEKGNVDDDATLITIFLVSFNLQSCCLMQSAVCGLRSAVCGLRSAVCGLRSTVCGLRSAVCSLRSAVCSLQSAVCGLRSAVCSLQSAVCILQSAKVIHRIWQALRLPSVPFPWSLAVHHQSLVSRSSLLPCEKRSA